MSNIGLGPKLSVKNLRELIRVIRIEENYYKLKKSSKMEKSSWWVSYLANWVKSTRSPAILSY